MTYSLASARKWCSDSKFNLVAASFGGKEMARVRARNVRNQAKRDARGGSTRSPRARGRGLLLALG